MPTKRMKIPAAERQPILDEYLIDGLSIMTIAASRNISDRRVRKLLRDSGIDTVAHGNMTRGKSISLTRMGLQ